MGSATGTATIRGRISSSEGKPERGFGQIGRQYEQDAVIHKGYYRDAELHALKDLPDLKGALLGSGQLGELGELFGGPERRK